MTRNALISLQFFERVQQGALGRESFLWEANDWEENGLFIYGTWNSGVMTQYKVKSVHQNVNEIIMDLGNANCLFFMKYQSTTLLQNQNIHIFLTSRIMQHVEKMDLLVSNFGNASRQQNLQHVHRIGNSNSRVNFVALRNSCPHAFYTYVKDCSAEQDKPQLQLNSCTEKLAGVA